MAFETALLANLVGASGVVLNFTWPLFRSRRSMLWAQATASACFATHYVMIGAPTGALMNAIGSVQALAAIPLGSRPGFRRIYLLTLPLIALGVIVTWRGGPSVLAALGMALTSLGRYQLEPERVRGFIMACIPFWMGHNLLTGSLPGLFSDVSVLSAGAWAMARDARRR